VVTNSLLHQLYSQPGWHAYVPWLVLTQPLALFSAFFIALLLVTFPDGHLPSTRWRWLVVGLALALAKVAVGQVVSPVSQSPGVPPSALANAALARLLDPVNSFDLNGLFFLAAASARVPLSSRARGRPGAGQVVLPGSGRVDRVHDRGRRGGRDLPPQRRPGLPAVGRFPGPGCGASGSRSCAIGSMTSTSSSAATLAYGILAVLVAFAYVGLVVGVGALVGRTNGSNLILSILATALVALAFNPLRAQLQTAANKLVYGRRESPYESLTGFTRGLGRQVHRRRCAGPDGRSVGPRGARPRGRRVPA